MTHQVLGTCEVSRQYFSLFSIPADDALQIYFIRTTLQLPVPSAPDVQSEVACLVQVTYSFHCLKPGSWHRSASLILITTYLLGASRASQDVFSASGQCQGSCSRPSTHDWLLDLNMVAHPGRGDSVLGEPGAVPILVCLSSEDRRLAGCLITYIALIGRQSSLDYCRLSPHAI